MVYKYVAYDADRKVVEGTIDAPNDSLAKEALLRSGYSLLSLKLTRQGMSLRRQIPTLFGIKAGDVIAFSRLLATLVQRGTTPVAALQLLRDQASNLTFREAIDDVIEALRQGASLSEAMGTHPEAFSPFYCRMVKLSEQTGNLEVVLRQVADYMEKDKALMARVSRALAYPAFVLLIAGGVITLLITVTLPSLSELFTEFGGQLPLPTRILVGLTGFVSTYKLPLLGLFLGAAILALWSVRKPDVRRRLDALLLKMPLIGPIVTLREMAHLTRMMSTGLSASLPMPEIMDMVVKTSKNTVVAEALDSLRGEILKGRRLSDSMTQHPVFPRLLMQMVKVGEEVGSLDEDLAAIAETYEADVDKRVNTLVALLEPGLMVVLGLVVAFIAVSVIIPIYSVLGEIG